MKGIDYIFFCIFIYACVRMYVSKHRERFVYSSTFPLMHQQRPKVAPFLCLFRWFRFWIVHFMCIHTFHTFCNCLYADIAFHFRRKKNTLPETHFEHTQNAKPLLFRRNSIINFGHVHTKWIWYSHKFFFSMPLAIEEQFIRDAKPLLLHTHQNRRLHVIPFGCECALRPSSHWNNE